MKQIICGSEYTGLPKSVIDELMITVDEKVNTARRFGKIIDITNKIKNRKNK